MLIFWECSNFLIKCIEFTFFLSNLLSKLLLFSLSFLFVYFFPSTIFFLYILLLFFSFESTYSTFLSNFSIIFNSTDVTSPTSSTSAYSINLSILFILHSLILCNILGESVQFITKVIRLWYVSNCFLLLL